MSSGASDEPHRNEAGSKKSSGRVVRPLNGRRGPVVRAATFEMITGFNEDLILYKVTYELIFPGQEGQKTYYFPALDFDNAYQLAKEFMDSDILSLEIVSPLFFDPVYDEHNPSISDSD